MAGNKDDFEGLYGSILHCSPHSSIDSVVSELLANEIHLTSQARKEILLLSNQSVLKDHWKSQCPKLLNRAPQ